MKHTMEVTALDLREWAKRYDCPPVLPRLLGRLVRATGNGVVGVRIPSDEAVYEGGLDGSVTSEEASEFVPAGHSVWEFGSGGDPEGKAEKDYRKRTDHPKGLDTKSATFIFVTPRLWSKKEDWVDKKKAEGSWRDVRAYDANDLAKWLDDSPSVSVWFSMRIGRRPNGALSLEDFYSEWVAPSLPHLTEQVVHAGRAADSEKIAEWLRRPASVFGLRAETAHEAAAFLFVAIKSMGQEERLSVLARSVVVETVEAWRELELRREPLLLVAQRPDSQALASAAAKGHHVFAPLSQSEPHLKEVAVLGRAEVECVKASLASAGIEEERVPHLARLARRSFAAFRRALSNSPSFLAPEWSRGDNSRFFVPLLLLGSWKDLPGERSDPDRAIVSRAVGADYKLVRDNLDFWASQPDPPLQFVNGRWAWTSREQAWLWLSSSVKATDLGAFRELALEVLGREDPSLELPVDERPMAGIVGKLRPESQELRTGMAQSIALLGAYSADAPLPERPSGQDWADAIVRDLLHEKDRLRWASISSELPYLAEASASAFLRAVAKDLAGREPELPYLFEDRDGSSFFCSSPHTGLLWALELVAWVPEHLASAARSLAALARLDPGGRLGNRPLSSLKEIFLYWHPCTAADLESRFRVIDHLRKHEPDVAWRVMLDSLPEGSSVAHPSSKPRWRDWGSGLPKPSSRAEHYKYARGAIRRCIEDLGEASERWTELISRAGNLPIEEFDAFVTMLESEETRPRRPEFRSSLWHAIRATAGRHAEFPDAGWSMPPDRIGRLLAASDQCVPSDPVERNRILFSINPPAMVPYRGNIQDFQQKVARVQGTAIKEVYDESGVEGLLELARAAEQPNQVGISCGATLRLPVKAARAALERGLASEDPRERRFAMGYLYGRGSRGAGSWARKQTETPWFRALPPGVQAAFAQALEFEPWTWDLVEGLGAATKEHYWRDAYPWMPDSSPAAHFERGAEELLAASRAADVITFAAGRPVDRLRISSGLSLRAIDALIADPTDGVDWQRVADSLVSMLGHLAGDPATDRGRIAELEWVFLPMFRGSDDRPKALNEALSREPGLFIDALSSIYKGRSEEKAEQVSEEGLMRASKCYELLRAWDRPPGTTEHGFDGAALHAWVREARNRAAACGCADIADGQIGEVMRHCPAGEDGVWPHESVRQLFEDLQSEELERGLRLSIHNARGVVGRSPEEGGDQERLLAKTYRDQAKALEGWPRLASVFWDLERDFLRAASDEDEWAEHERRFAE